MLILKIKKHNSWDQFVYSNESRTFTTSDYRHVFSTDNNFMTYNLRTLLYKDISTKVENYSTSFLTKVKRFFK